MEKKDIDEFFIKNETKIMRYINVLYKNIYKYIYSDILEPTELFDELYIYCITHGYKFKILSLSICLDSGFQYYLSTKYETNIYEYKRLLPALEKANEYLKKCNDINLSITILYDYVLEKQKYHRSNKTLLTLKKIDKEIDDETL